MARGASVREGETAVDAATAEFAPTFFGQGGYSYESNEFNPNPNVFSLLLGGRINLFSGFSDAAARRGALLAVEQRKEELALARDEVALAVKRAHLLAVEAEKRKAVAEVAIERAEENLRIQNDRYREGLAISTEVLDAQTLLTRAKVDLANASFDVVEARYDLLAERGELLEFLGPLLGAEKGP
jgi:outer membrane protein TolC